MFKKLTKQIVLFNVLFPGIVITLVIFMPFINLYFNNSKINERILHNWAITGVENQTALREGIRKIRPSIDERQMVYFETGRPLPTIDKEYFDEQELLRIWHRQSKNTKSEKLIYAFSKDGGAMVAVSVKNLRQELIKSLQTAVLQWLLLMTGLLIVSSLLAKKLVKPVSNAFDTHQHFIQDASHELKTPITIILANADIALRENKNNTCASNTKSAAIRMKKVVDQMLKLTKTDAVESEKNTICFSELVQSVCLSYDVLCMERKLSFIQHIEENIYVHGNEDRLEDLLNIILENAVNYTPTNEKIVVKLFLKSSEIYLSVQNTGACIDEKDLSHIFERFYRGKTTNKAQGSGLGLSIAQSIVKDHKGSITLDSNEKIGNLITVKLNKYNKK